jgi:plasmid segregation protein ParM
MEVIVRAIDVGFGNTKYVKGLTSEAKVECAHFPSIAYLSKGHGESIEGGKRKTVCVPVDRQIYEVGPKVHVLTDGFEQRANHDGFIETNEYRALMAGALHYMKVDHVDLLVLGLPVARFFAKRQQLAKSMTGEFDVGGEKTVVVRRVHVVAQPLGAMYGELGLTRKGNEHVRNLVIDAGSR